MTPVEFIPFALDEHTVKMRVLSFMGSGLLGAGKLAENATFTVLEPTWVPARFATFTLVSNWTAQVEIRSENISRNTIISFDIRADMWAEPIPIELYLRSSVDVTTGQVSLERSG